LLSPALVGAVATVTTGLGHGQAPVSSAVAALLIGPLLGALS
jgi:hypothetical protein